MRREGDARNPAGLPTAGAGAAALRCPRATSKGLEGSEQVALEAGAQRQSGGLEVLGEQEGWQAGPHPSACPCPVLK